MAKPKQSEIPGMEKPRDKALDRVMADYIKSTVDEKVKVSKLDEDEE